MFVNGAAGQCICAPPSTTSVWPVMKSLSAAQRNTAAPPTSCGSSVRLIERGLKPLLVLRVARRVDLVHADRESRRDGIDSDVAVACEAEAGISSLTTWLQGLCCISQAGRLRHITGILLRSGNWPGRLVLDPACFGSRGIAEV
jgi:hypothetical protein